MYTKNYQSRAGLFATLLAIGCFAAGTLLLILRALMPMNDRLIFAGCYFVFIALPANSLAVLFLLYCCVRRFEYRRYYGQKIFLLLCNIPVAWLYAYVALEIIN